MPPIIIHAGFHKTGTTWLQENLFQYNDKQRIVYSEERARIRGNFVVPRYKGFSPSAVKYDLSKLLESSQRSGLPLLLSDEALMGFPYNAKFSQEVTMMRIRDTFPDAMIMLTVREQRDLIRSYYGHYIRGGGTAKLADFLAQPDGPDKRLYDTILNLDFFDFTETGRFLDQLFGPDKVMIAPMEWLIGNTRDFIGRLTHAFGVALDECRQSERSSVINPAWSPLAFEAARCANHLSAGKPLWRRRSRFVQPNRLASVVDRYTPTKVRESGLRKQNALIEAALGDRFT